MVTSDASTLPPTTPPSSPPCSPSLRSALPLRLRIRPPIPRHPFHANPPTSIHVSPPSTLSPLVPASVPSALHPSPHSSPLLMSHPPFLSTPPSSLLAQPRPFGPQLMSPAPAPAPTSASPAPPTTSALPSPQAPPVTTTPRTTSAQPAPVAALPYSNLPKIPVKMPCRKLATQQNVLLSSPPSPSHLTPCTSLQKPCSPSLHHPVSTRPTPSQLLQNSTVGPSACQYSCHRLGRGRHRKSCPSYTGPPPKRRVPPRPRISSSSPRIGASTQPVVLSNSPSRIIAGVKKLTHVPRATTRIVECDIPPISELLRNAPCARTTNHVRPAQNTKSIVHSHRVNACSIAPHERSCGFISSILTQIDSAPLASDNVPVVTQTQTVDTTQLIRENALLRTDVLLGILSPDYDEGTSKNVLMFEENPALRIRDAFGILALARLGVALDVKNRKRVDSIRKPSMVAALHALETGTAELVGFIRAVPASEVATRRRLKRVFEKVHLALLEALPEMVAKATLHLLQTIYEGKGDVRWAGVICEGIVKPLLMQLEVRNGNVRKGFVKDVAQLAMQVPSKSGVRDFCAAVETRAAIVMGVSDVMAEMSEEMVASAVRGGDVVFGRFASGLMVRTEMQRGEWDTENG